MAGQTGEWKTLLWVIIALAQGRCFEDSFRISKRFLMVCSAMLATDLWDIDMDMDIGKEEWYVSYMPMVTVVD